MTFFVCSLINNFIACLVSVYPTLAYMFIQAIYTVSLCVLVCSQKQRISYKIQRPEGTSRRNLLAFGMWCVSFSTLRSVEKGGGAGLTGGVFGYYGAAMVFQLHSFDV